MTDRFALTWVFLLVLLLAGCEKDDAKPVAGAVVDKTVTLASMPDGEHPQPVPPSLGMGLHVPPVPTRQIIFSKNGGGVAYSVETGDKVQVVHNGRAGKRYDAVGAMVLSPDGRRIAYGALAGGRWRMVVDGVEGAAYSTVKAPLFSPDGAHLAYQAMSGEKWYLVVDTTTNEGTDTRFVEHRFSGDSGYIAYIAGADRKNRGRLVISDLAFARRTTIAAGVASMTLSQDGSRLAAIASGHGGQRVVVCSFDRPDEVKSGPAYDSVYALSVSPDGASLAYGAERDGIRMIVFDDREEMLRDGDSLVEAPVVLPDRKGVGAIILRGNRAGFQRFFNDQGNPEPGYDEASSLVYNRDGSVHAHVARKGNDWFVVVNGAAGAAFDRVISPKFSPKGNYLVYRARKDGKRFVVVANGKGKIIRRHPPYEQVFDVEFTADGKSVAYGVKDGQQLVWRVERL